MTKDNQDSNYQDEEIDLKRLFQLIGQWLISIWNWLLGIVIAIRNLTFRYIVLIVIFTALSAGYSFYITKVNDPYYQGSFIIVTDYLNKSVAENIVSSLNNLSSERLSDTLGLDSLITSKILSISVNVFKSEEDRLKLERVKDKLTESNFDISYKSIVEDYLNASINSYEFIINSTDNNDLKLIIDSLSKYCRNYPYIRKRVEINRYNLELKKQKLRNESGKIDSLKMFIVKNIETMGDRSRQGSNNVILADDVNANPLNVFDQDLKLYDQELQINKELALEEDFQVFEGSYLVSTPASPTFLDNFKKWVLYSLALSYTIIFLIQINKYLNKVELENKKNN